MASNVNVLPLLSQVPVILTAPPTLLLIVPSWAVEKLPPRFNVEVLSTTVAVPPALFQLPAKATVDPLLELMLPVLVQFVALRLVVPPPVDSIVPVLESVSGLMVSVELVSP